MLNLNNIKPSKGSTKRSKRVGRGNGSGKGTFCGRGMNGQNSRSGGGVAPWFEGGQTPLFRRLPKLKGFSNAKFSKKYSIINLSSLEELAKKGITEITPEILLENKIIRNKNLKIKVLGEGEITYKIILKINKLSKTAEEKIINSGGQVELI